MIDRAFLKENLETYGFVCSEELAEHLDKYAELLVEWNGKMNLTAITAPDEIVIKHFLDSLLLHKAMELPAGSSIIDVGTGAGFPSIPVCLYQPDLKLTLLDSLNKRITFLTERFLLRESSGSSAGTVGILSALCKGRRLLYLTERL